MDYLVLILKKKKKTISSKSLVFGKLLSCFSNERIYHSVGLLRKFNNIRIKMYEC